MTLIRSPKPKSLDDIFKKYEFQIPDLQRDYDWKTEQLNKFWEDANNVYRDDITEYFFGPMVFVEKNPGDVRKIIDGQQRLITASILIALARDFCKKLNNQSAVDQLNRLLFSSMTYQGQPQKDVLRPNPNNELFYKDFILKVDDPDKKLGQTKPEVETNQKIFSAYKFFKKKFDEIGQTYDLSQYLPLFLEKIMKSFLTIEILVDSEEAGHRVFETLNYRGLDLSISSLVKNYLLEKSSDSDLGTNLSKWREITNNIENKTMDDFLKHHWISRHELVTPSNLFDKIKGKIDQSQKVNQFLDELIEDSKIYKQLRYPEKLYWYDDQDVVEYIEDLNDLRNDNAQPLLLAAKRIWNDKTKFRELTKVCSIIHFRAKSIGPRNASQMVNTMYNVLKQLSEKKNSYSIKDVLNEFKKIDTTKEEFELSFREKWFSGAEASYVLRKIEINKDGAYAVKRATAKATIEHILPQNLSDEWRKKFDEETHEECVDLIGNLTILHDVLNKSIQNNSFDDKKDVYKDQKDVSMTLELAKKPTWEEKDIKDRTKEFTKHALDIWKLN